MLNPYESLCYLDPRNPNAMLDLDELQPDPRDGCFCDNCFHGRDALALEIIRLREAFQDAAIYHEHNPDL